MRAALKSFDQAESSTEATARAIDQLRSLRALLYATGGDVAEMHQILERTEEFALGADDRARLGGPTIGAFWVDQSAQFWVEGANEAASSPPGERSRSPSRRRGAAACPGAVPPRPRLLRDRRLCASN